METTQGVKERALAAARERVAEAEFEVGRVVLINMEEALNRVESLLGVTGEVAEVVYAPRTLLVGPEGVVVKLDDDLYVEVRSNPNAYQRKYYLVLVTNDGGKQSWSDDSFILPGKTQPIEIRNLADLGDALLTLDLV